MVVAVAELERPSDDVAVRLGAGLKETRTRVGISQAELARRMSTPGELVPPNYISRWEAGGRRLDVETIERMERLLGVQRGTVWRLAGYVEDDALDLGSLDPAAQKAIRAILRAFEDGSGEPVSGDSRDGS